MSQVNSPLDLSRLANVYNQAVRAPDVWNEAPNYLQGQGVTVAVVDSGVFNTDDLNSRLIANVNFNASYHDSADAYGHGTFVAGIVAGDGTLSGGTYIGIAPQANVVNVRVSDDAGGCSESDLISGLQWVNDNRATYKIRVVNLSLNATVAQSYNVDPLDAAVEILWFNGVVVVASGGNNGTSTVYPPANDPFVITVGATDDHGTTGLADDAVAHYSAYGIDETGAVKPDLVAPGTNIIGLLPNNDLLRISRDHPDNRINSNYFRMSGTSMAAPVVAGAAALLIESNSNLTPDQIKYRLKATASHNLWTWPGYDPIRAGAGYLDIYAAIHSNLTGNANTGLRASLLLTSGGAPIDWNNVAWNSVAWNSVAWNSVAWNSDYWDP
jgi:serine protease AprX